MRERGEELQQQECAVVPRRELSTHCGSESGALLCGTDQKRGQRKKGEKNERKKDRHRETANTHKTRISIEERKESWIYL